jgi:hypothetical protein
MAQINLSDELYARVLAFKPFLESVLEVSLETDTFFEMLVRLAPDFIIAEAFKGVEPAVFLSILQQLGQEHPETYAAVASIMDRAEEKAIETIRRAEMRQRLGFKEPGEEK